MQGGFIHQRHDDLANVIVEPRLVKLNVNNWEQTLKTRYDLTSLQEDFGSVVKEHFLMLAFSTHSLEATLP